MYAGKAYLALADGAMLICAKEFVDRIDFAVHKVGEVFRVASGGEPSLVH